jgi:hypothetical protein
VKVSASSRNINVPLNHAHLGDRSGGVGFEPTIEVAPDAGFQDLVLVIQTSWW